MKRIVFMGTPEIAVESLERLAAEYEILLVVTQPDRPKGRGKKLAPPPVKLAAERLGLPILQVERIGSAEGVQELTQLAPDLIVVVAFGQLLPERILNIAPCINLHASLLPKYRGAAPINWAIIEGESTTGITTMYMDKGLDTGDMLLKKEIAITNEMTAGELTATMATEGAELLSETLRNLDNIERQPQGETPTIYAKMLTKELARIDWTKDATSIHNLVRGLNPEPMAWTTLDGDNYKIARTRVVEGDGDPGTVIAASKSGITVATGKGAVEILEIQPAGKKLMTAAAFYNGKKDLVGKTFS